jgi:hypothetical protein
MAREYVKPLLTDLAIKYKNADMKYIADQVCPFVPVETQEGQYRSFAKKNYYTLVDNERGATDTAKEINWTVTLSAYNCGDKAVRFFLTDSELRNQQNQGQNGAAALDITEEITQVLTAKIFQKREKRIANLFFTAGSYDSTNKIQLTGDDKWSGYSTSDPIANLLTGYRACMIPPNTLIVGPAVYDVLVQHSKILQRITGGATSINPANVTPEMLAAIFRVKRVLVGEAMYDSTPNKPSTFTKANIWGKHALLAYITETPSTLDASFAKTFLFTPEGGTSGWRVRMYRDEARGGGGEWLEVEQSVDEKILAADVGYFIEDAVA